MRLFRYAAAVLIVAYLILTPDLIRRGLAREPYVEWLTPEKPAWEGRIELWHIVSFKVWQGSVTHYLEERAAAYGAGHTGVHIEVIGMTVAQFESRVARGAFPDAYSFPTGLLYAERLQATDYGTPEFRGNICAAAVDGETYAVPWMMSGYFLAGNMQLMAKYHLTMPEQADAEFLQSVLSVDAGAPQLAMPALLAARAGLGGALAADGDFTGGRAALAVLDARTVGELVRGAGMPLSVLPYASWTDQVQYLGASRQTDAARAAIVADFAEFLLSDGEQNRLSTLGALPVTAAAAPAYTAPEVETLWEAASEPVAPEPFAYQRHRDALEAEAAAALAGDEYAKKSFWERLAVVENREL